MKTVPRRVKMGVIAAQEAWDDPEIRAALIRSIEEQATRERGVPYRFVEVVTPLNTTPREPPLSLMRVVRLEVAIDDRGSQTAS